jgi:hypothetical protein
MATSAIWNAASRTWPTTFAAILIGFFLERRQRPVLGQFGRGQRAAEVGGERVKLEYPY